MNTTVFKFEPKNRCVVLTLIVWRLKPSIQVCRAEGCYNRVNFNPDIEDFLLSVSGSNANVCIGSVALMQVLSEQREFLVEAFSPRVERFLWVTCRTNELEWGMVNYMCMCNEVALILWHLLLATSFRLLASVPRIRTRTPSALSYFTSYGRQCYATHNCSTSRPGADIQYK